MIPRYAHFDITCAYYGVDSYSVFASAKNIAPFLKKWAYPSLFFFKFVFSILYNWQINFCLCCDLNRGSTKSEATALPTVLQPLPFWWPAVLYQLAKLAIFELGVPSSTPGQRFLTRLTLRTPEESFGFRHNFVSDGLELNQDRVFVSDRPEKSRIGLARFF